jgi:hypothetical protein
MKRCKTHLVRVCLLLTLAVPAYSQRGTFGIDVGQTTDKFGSLPSKSGLEAGIDGQLTIIQSNPKKGGPSIVAGGEIRLPTDTSNHAKEYALYGGLAFQVHNLTIGADAQVRKIILPPANVNNQVFIRDKMELLEIPLVVKYTFGSSKKAFIQAQGAPEFSPRFRSAGSLLQLPNPNFDHGYFVRASAGYVFGKWYAKATYESRYFKFAQNPNNPNNLYNWRSNLISGGVGFAF